MGAEVKVGSALPASSRLALGLGKGHAYATGASILGTLLGTVLLFVGGALLLGWLLSANGEAK